MRLQLQVLVFLGSAAVAEAEAEHSPQLLMKAQQVTSVRSVRN